jgi:MYXO-CTERM domain-containing protein
LSGTVTDRTLSPISGIEVRLWQEGDKSSFVPAVETLTNASGAYSFTGIEAGNYRVDARMPDGFTGNWGDRWYDVEPPNSGGYIAQDADTLVIEGADNLTSINLMLEIMGGFDGAVAHLGTYRSGLLVRAEWVDDLRYEHTDITASSPETRLGLFSMRGLIDYGDHDYGFFIYDPAGIMADAYYSPFRLIPDSSLSLEDFEINQLGTDPHEPNNSRTDAGAFSVDNNLTWTTTGAHISPRSGTDVDWFCFSAEVDDRYLLYAWTTVMTGGLEREHPWMDPILSFWSYAGPTLLAEDDDSGLGFLESFIDTGPIAVRGDYCAVVSSYGDTAWNGVGQQWAGHYLFELAMGNRPPTISATFDGFPIGPEGILVGEDELIVIDLVYSDPDDDVVDLRVVQIDSGDVEVLDGVLEYNEGTGTYTWDTGHRAADFSPYVVTLTVADNEFERSFGFLIEVEYINIPPTTPVPILPENDAVVELNWASLVVENSNDLDEDDLFYEYRLYFGQAGGDPVYSVLVAENDSGQTSFDTEPIPENMEVYWTVRAFDGQEENAYSPWTGFMRFRIDTENEPPFAPALRKPYSGETVLVRVPSFSATNPEDPDGDDVFLTFQVAADPEFLYIFEESPPVPVNRVSVTTAWLITIPMTWGSEYWARAYAEDSRGLRSAFSNVNNFLIARANQAPSISASYDSAPIPDDGITISEGDTTTIDLAFFDPDGDDLVLSVEHLNTAFFRHDDGVLEVEDGTATYTWTAGPKDAMESPETIEFAVSDGEFAARTRALINVLPVNEPPAVVELLSPADNAFVTTLTAELVVFNTTDPDEDELTYEFEVYFSDDEAEAPDLSSGVVEEGPTGETAWTTGEMSEGTEALWRARAFDGNEENGYGPWSEQRRFFVDTLNDPPEAPVLLQPADQQLIRVQDPELSATVPADPEQDDVSIRFEVSNDAEFEEIVTRSRGIRPEALGLDAMWQIDEMLRWGSEYYARAYAVDDRGAVSPYSNVNLFTIRENGVPDIPAFGEPLSAQCVDALLDERPRSITVFNVTDPEGARVSLQLQIFPADANPEADTPLFDTTVAQSRNGETTDVPIDQSVMRDDNSYLIRVRAFDGFDYTGWAQCTFVIDSGNSPPGPVAIITPQEGQSFPRGTVTMLILVDDAVDPDIIQPEDHTIDIAYCWTTGDTSNCSVDQDQWARQAQSSLDGSGTTSFIVNGLLQDTTVVVTAAAVDEGGLYGPSDNVAFTIGGDDEVGGGSPEACGCSPAGGGGAPTPLVGLALFAFVVALRRRRAQRA